MQKYFNILDKKILLTGGTGYLGRIVLQLFTQYGADVVFTDILDENTVHHIIDGSQTRSKNHYIKCDVKESSQVKNMVKSAVEVLGGLDILVNCAASAQLAFAEKLSDEQWDETIKVSLYGSYHCCREVFPYLKNKGGAIVNVASIAAIIGLPRGTTHHSAAKAGMLGMTRSLAVEWAKYGIRVNGIAPGQFDTGPLREVMKNPDYARDILENIPLGRVGTCQEIAMAVLFLASNASTYITGHTLVVDGGATIA